jgi:short-subunit dehydrogenase
MSHIPQVILVTGASSGIGESIASFLHQKGNIVYGTSRNTPKQHSSGFHLVQLNINDTNSVNQCVQNIISKEGRIDVLVNNAGIGLAGAVEEITEEDVRLILDTNVVGLHRTCQAVLPHMRQQRSGKIINIGSMAGMIGLPFRAYYSATKFAVEGFSEALSMEIKQFGIKVVLVQPGDMKTKINQNRIEIEGDQHSPYFKSFNFVRAKFNHAVDNAFDPVVIAKIVNKVILAKNPNFRYKKGAFFENFSLTVKRIVPFRWFETFVTMYYQMNKLVK